jgi:hypothetical protein
MGQVRQALKMQRDAQRLRALAPEYDPIRRDFELGLATSLEAEAQELLMPHEPLKTGLGGEIIPPVTRGLPGLESVLKEPDLLNLGASEQRAQLLEQTGVLELGIETAQDARAEGSVQKMITHQMAALHSRAMTMLAESEGCKDPDIAVKKARASTRMVDAFSRCALALQRLQTGGGQTIQVQYMQVNAMVGDASEKMQNLTSCAPVNKGGRPPNTGYRTKKSVEQRINDRELLFSVKRMEDIG